MNRAQQLLDEGRKCCYYVNQSGESRMEGDQRVYRVSLVFENEPGHFPTGGGDVAPWFWDEATCERMNQERWGLTDVEALEIVLSSMAAGKMTPA